MEARRRGYNKDMVGIRARLESVRARITTHIAMHACVKRTLTVVVVTAIVADVGVEIAL